jgi:hypothetical protein
MRIRIIQRPSTTQIDGVRVDCYCVGQEYDVSNTLGEVFLAEGWAEPVPLDASPGLAPLPVPIYSKS